MSNPDNTTWIDAGFPSYRKGLVASSPSAVERKRPGDNGGGTESLSQDRVASESDRKEAYNLTIVASKSGPELSSNRFSAVEGRSEQTSQSFQDAFAPKPARANNNPQNASFNHSDSAPSSASSNGGWFSSFVSKAKAAVTGSSSKKTILSPEEEASVRAGQPPSRPSSRTEKLQHQGGEASSADNSSSSTPSAAGVALHGARPDPSSKLKGAVRPDSNQSSIVGQVQNQVAASSQMLMRLGAALESEPAEALAYLYSGLTFEKFTPLSVPDWQPEVSLTPPPRSLSTSQLLRTQQSRSQQLQSATHVNSLEMSSSSSLQEPPGAQSPSPLPTSISAAAATASTSAAEGGSVGSTVSVDAAGSKPLPLRSLAAAELTEEKEKQARKEDSCSMLLGPSRTRGTVTLARYNSGCPRTNYTLWLLRALANSITHPLGGHLTAQFFVPSGAWFVPDMKVNGLTAKLKALSSAASAFDQLKVEVNNLNTRFPKVTQFFAVTPKVLGTDSDNRDASAGARTPQTPQMDLSTTVVISGSAVASPANSAVEAPGLGISGKLPRLAEVDWMSLISCGSQALAVIADAKRNLLALQRALAFEVAVVPTLESAGLTGTGATPGGSAGATNFTPNLDVVAWEAGQARRSRFPTSKPTIFACFSRRGGFAFPKLNVKSAQKVGAEGRVEQPGSNQDWEGDQADHQSRGARLEGPKVGFLDKLKLATYNAMQEATRLGKSVIPTRLTHDQSLEYARVLVAVCRSSQFIQQIYLQFGFLVSPPAFEAAPRDPSLVIDHETLSSQAASITRIRGVTSSLSSDEEVQFAKSDSQLSPSAPDDALAVHCIAQELRHDLDVIVNWLTTVLTAIMLDDLSRNLPAYTTSIAKSLLDG